MKREDVLKLFPDATDEQITKLLNQNNTEVAGEKDKSKKIQAELDDLKASAVNAEELQKKIEEIEQSKLTEKEKIEKELEKSNQRVAELERIGRIRDQREAAAAKFKVTAEQAKQIVKDDGSFDYDILGTIIAEKETAAALAKEQEIASAAGNPGGQNGSTPSDEKSMAVRLVEKNLSKQTAQTDILSHYVNGGK